MIHAVDSVLKLPKLEEQESWRKCLVGYNFLLLKYFLPTQLNMSLYLAVLTVVKKINKSKLWLHHVLHPINPSYVVCFLAGESGVHLPGHFHSGVLPKDSSIWAFVPWRSLFTKLLEHIRLCHCVHGVRWHLECPEVINKTQLSPEMIPKTVLNSSSNIDFFSL